MFFRAKAFREAAKQFRQHACEAPAHAVNDSCRSHDLIVAMKLQSEGLWQRDKKKLLRSFDTQVHMLVDTSFLARQEENKV